MADQNYNININAQANGADESTSKIKNLNNEVNKLEKSSDGLGAKLKGLGGDFKGLGGSADEAFDSVKNIAGAFTGVAGVAAGLAAAVGAVTVALIANGAAMAALADENDELAQKMGVTTTELEALKLIAGENGGTVEGLVKVYDKLSKALNKNEEDNLKSINAFRALGLSQEHLAGLTEKEIAGKVIKNWEAMGRSSQATAAVIQILGASFREQIPAIKAAADAGEEYAERIKKYGGVASEALVKAGGELEKANGNLSQVLKETRLIFAEFFSGSLAEAIQWLADTADTFNKFIKNLDVIPNKFNEIVAKLGASQIDVSKLRPVLPGEEEWVRVYEELQRRDEKMSWEKRRKKLGAATGGGRGFVNPSLIVPDTPKPLGDIADPNKKDPFKEAVLDLKKTISLTKESTEVEKMFWETKFGKYKDFTLLQKSELLTLADKIDLQVEETALEKEREKLGKEMFAEFVKNAKEEERLTENYNNLLKRQKDLIKQVTTEFQYRGDAATEGMSIQRDTTGMSSIDKETFVALKENAYAANQIISELNKNLETYDEDVRKIRDAEAGANEKIKQSAEERKAYQADWLNGAKEAFGEYSDYATNIADQTKNAFGNAFKGAEDAMTSFIMTGKLNFKDFAKSIIAGIARMYAEMVVLWTIQKAVGFFTGGSSPSNAESINAAAGAGGWYANGGDPPVGKISVVGERGPELFVPKTAGTIVPNHQLGGNKVTIQNTIAVSIGSVDSTEREQTLLRTLDEKIRVITYESVGELMRDGNALSMVRR